jgi:hypothetical protein
MMLGRAIIVIIVILFVAWLVGGLIRDRTRR